MSDRQVKPLRPFNFKIVQEPLTGLLRNMDSDLQRRIKQVEAARDVDQYMQLTLLLIMLRVAINSYQAVGFLLTDLDQNPKRLDRFVIVVPPINRQIMDLWFTVVYLLDDFEPRRIIYEKGAYRELRKVLEESELRYGTDPESQDWLEDMREFAKRVETQSPLNDEEKRNPSSIPSWPHPHSLSEKPTKSQDFLKFLDKFLYGETSVEAHLKPAGLMLVAGIVLSDIAPEHVSQSDAVTTSLSHLKRRVEDRSIHQYKFRHLSRTVITLLGIISEIEMHCKLNNKEQAIKIWEQMAEYSADAKDIYEARYKAGLSS